MAPTRPRYASTQLFLWACLWLAGCDCGSAPHEATPGDLTGSKNAELPAEPAAVATEPPNDRMETGQLPEGVDPPPANKASGGTQRATAPATPKATAPAAVKRTQSTTTKLASATKKAPTPKAPTPKASPVATPTPTSPKPSRTGQSTSTTANTPAARTTSTGTKSSSSTGASTTAPVTKVAVPTAISSHAAKTDPAPKPQRSPLPTTANVRFEVTESMQSLLDKDPRMANWVRRILPSLDGCYQQARGSNGNAGGTIAVQVTMHENARPSAKVQSVPSKLSSMVSCATTKLWNKRPPLFTGPEGQRHTVRIHFGS